MMESRGTFDVEYAVASLAEALGGPNTALGFLAALIRSLDGTSNDLDVVRRLAASERGVGLVGLLMMIGVGHTMNILEAQLDAEEAPNVGTN